MKTLILVAVVTSLVAMVLLVTGSEGANVQQECIGNYEKCETASGVSLGTVSVLLYNKNAVGCIPPTLYLTGGGFLSGGLCPEGSLSRRVSVQGAPLGVQILSISCSFWENLAKSYVGVLPLGGLALSLRGNPGSATV